MHWRARQCAQSGLGAATFTGAKMEPLDLWRLCNVLTVPQAAMLLAGANPSSASWPDGYEAAPAAVLNGLLSGA